jgi:hypothetical protein
VVGVRARDDELPVRLAHRTPVRPAQLGRGVDGVGAAAGGEEHLGVPDRYQSGDALGECLGGPVGEHVEGLVAGDLPHLRGRRVGEFGAAVADVAVPEAGDRIEVGAAGVVMQRRGLAAHDRDRVTRGRGHVRETVPQHRPRRVIGHRVIGHRVIGCWHEGFPSAARPPVRPAAATRPIYPGGLRSELRLHPSDPLVLAVSWQEPDSERKDMLMYSRVPADPVPDLGQRSVRPVASENGYSPEWSCRWLTTYRGLLPRTGDGELPV